MHKKAQVEDDWFLTHMLCKTSCRIIMCVFGTENDRHIWNSFSWLPPKISILFLCYLKVFWQLLWCRFEAMMFQQLFLWNKLSELITAQTSFYHFQSLCLSCLVGLAIQCAHTLIVFFPVRFSPCTRRQKIDSLNVIVYDDTVVISFPMKGSLGALVVHAVNIFLRGKKNPLCITQLWKHLYLWRVQAFSLLSFPHLFLFEFVTILDASSFNKGFIFIPHWCSRPSLISRESIWFI